MRSAALLLFTALALRAQSPCSNIPTYSTCELVFELPAGHSDPYKTVELKAEFRSPRHRTFAMPGFWPGGNRMVIRFAPTEAGDWDYRVTSNVKEFDGKIGNFTASASQSPGFIRAANVHHWAYTEKDARGLDQAHLWMGANEPHFASEGDEEFRAAADARAAQKFNHIRGVLDAAMYSAPDAPNLAYFQKLDERIRYLNSKGVCADLVFAADGASLVKIAPAWDQRRRFLRYLIARYAPMHITWHGVEHFEDTLDARTLLKEIGSILKELDPYQHPRTTGARVTSAPLLDDGWMNFASYGSNDSNINAIEHQLYAAPFVNFDFGAETTDTAAFRHRLWNVAMDGQSPTYAPGSGLRLDSAGAKQMSVWYDFFADTRYWELEPYYDVDGGRALALEDIEYIVYIEKPGPLELTVEKHGYDVYWVNPADGEVIKEKKFSGNHFTGQPPDRSHDWILHVVREGRLESMNRSYKFESREIVLQEIEANNPKVPFTIDQPSGDLSLKAAAPYVAKLTKETRATRTMWFLWTGDVSAGGQGYRVIGTGASGTMRTLNGIAKEFPAIMHLRLYGMNANGKVYALDRALSINP
ncbi:MAG TPA: DUF5060 domain-containing protein [Candidatus Solibacter sp.]|nr:DUF5060 domain-containing protein [Candidatus Solibacter sp.]